jgi:hypothetical protein
MEKGEARSVEAKLEEGSEENGEIFDARPATEISEHRRGVVVDCPSRGDCERGPLREAQECATEGKMRVVEIIIKRFGII